MNSLSHIRDNVTKSIKKVWKKFPAITSAVLAGWILAWCNDPKTSMNGTPITHSVSLTDTTKNENPYPETAQWIDTIIASNVGLILSGHKAMCDRKVWDPNCQDTYETIGSPISYEKFIERIYVVNNFINTNITPEEDIVTHGINEYWSNPITDQIWSADCENYVLAKFDMLAFNEWIPRNRMRMAVVTLNDWSGHAIWVIDTDKGIVIIDNLTHETQVLHKNPETWGFIIAFYNQEGTITTDTTINTLSEWLEFYWYKLISYWWENSPKEYRRPIEK